MAKFCSKCGSLVDDNAAFCNNCGSPMIDGYPEAPNTANANDPYANTTAPQQPAYQQPAYQQPAPQQPMYQQPAYRQPVPQQPAAPNPYPYQPAQPVNYYAPTPAPKKKKTGLIIAISVAAFLLIATAALLLVILPVCGTDVFGLNWFSASNKNTPAGCVETFIEELADNDVDGVLDCIYETEYSDLMRSVLKSQFSSSMDLSDVLGEAKSLGKENIKKMLKVQITDEEPLTGTELAEWKQQLSAMTIPTDKIETIEKAKVKLTNTLENTDQEKTFYFVKAEGKWYILASAMAGTF